MAPNKVEYKVAVIKVEKAFGNIKKARKSASASSSIPVVNLVGHHRLNIRRRPDAQLAKDQEACLFLNKHFEADFYVMPAYFSVITRTKDNKEAFEKDVAEVERRTRLLADPMSGLEAKKADDRLATVALLLTRYQSVRPYSTGTPRKSRFPQPRARPS